MTPLLKTYLERIRAEHSKLDARGVMQMHRQVDMALDDIYVTLTRASNGSAPSGGPLSVACYRRIGRGTYGFAMNRRTS